jgi:hypothetical protein
MIDGGRVRPVSERRSAARMSPPGGCRDFPAQRCMREPGVVPHREPARAFG